ncbi:MAG: type II toxin-antitoxin system PemK/MazF family toxin [archaeon]
MKIKRGDVFLVNFEPVKGSEQGSVRPALIIQNDISNENSPVTIVAPITSKIYEKEYPTNVFITKEESKLPKDSTILLNQIRAIDKSRLFKRLSSLNESIMKKVNSAIKISLGLN